MTGTAKGALAIEMLMTAAEVGKAVRASEFRVLDWRKAGLLPGVVLGSRVLFDPADVREFIRRAKTDAVPPMNKAKISEVREAARARKPNGATAQNGTGTARRGRPRKYGLPHAP